MKKRPFILLLAAILASALFIYLIGFIWHSLSGADQASAAIAVGQVGANEITLVFMILLAMGTVLSWVGWICSYRWAANTAGVLMAVSLCQTFLWLVLIPMVLCFVGATKLE